MLHYILIIQKLDCFFLRLSYNIMNIFLAYEFIYKSDNEIEIVKFEKYSNSITNSFC